MTLMFPFLVSAQVLLRFSVKSLLAPCGAKVVDLPAVIGGACSGLDGYLHPTNRVMNSGSHIFILLVPDYYLLSRFPVSADSSGLDQAKLPSPILRNSVPALWDCSSANSA